MGTKSITQKIENLSFLKNCSPKMAILWKWKNNKYLNTDLAQSGFKWLSHVSGSKLDWVLWNIQSHHWAVKDTKKAVCIYTPCTSEVRNGFFVCNDWKSNTYVLTACTLLHFWFNILGICSWLCDNFICLLMEEI